MIDRTKFAALPNAVILDWHKRGWLGLTYARFLSQGSWAVLVELAATRT